MKIGFDAKRLYSNYTGLGNYSRTIVKNLLDFYKEEDYHLYTTKINNSVESTFFQNHPRLKTRISQAKLKSYWRSYSIIDDLKTDQIDLFHGLSNEIPQSLKRSKIKSVVTIHDLIFKVLPETYPYIDRKIYDLKFKSSCRNADKVIAISENTKQDLIKYYQIPEDKIEVIYQCCNPIYYNQNIEADANKILSKFNLPSEYLLFVGSIEKRKNLKLILDAFQKLKESDQIPLVIICGGRSFNKELTDLISKQDFEKKLIWIKNLKDNEDLQVVYQNAQALLYPSLYEGFGLPVVEALLSKTPVITSNNSSLPEAAGPNSLLINPKKSSELAHAISKVLNNSELRAEMIEKGYQYAHNKFSAKTLTSQLYDCYKDLIK